MEGTGFRRSKGNVDYLAWNKSHGITVIYRESTSLSPLAHLIPLCLTHVQDFPGLTVQTGAKRGEGVGGNIYIIAYIP